MTVGRILRPLLLASALAATSACVFGEAATSEGKKDEVAMARQAVLNGRASGDAENDAVYVENTSVPGTPVRCSGTLVAPNLVVTARHCLLRSGELSISCTPEGELADPNDPLAQETRPATASAVTARYGSSAENAVTAHGVSIVSPPALTLCKSDIGFIVLDRPLAPGKLVPLRVSPVTLGETFRFSGWGYVTDRRDQLPTTRFALDDLRVEEVGPNLIPPGTFATHGNTLCFGDSGGGARIDDALIGVYSRIEGDSCSTPQARNVFMMLGPHRELIDRAFAEAGVRPWYEGEPAPWLIADGAACTTDAACISGRCREGVCVASCDGGPCASLCEGDACTPPSVAPGNDRGCAVARGGRSSEGLSFAIGFMMLFTLGIRIGTRPKADPLHSSGRSVRRFSYPMISKIWRRG